MKKAKSFFIGLVAVIMTLMACGEKQETKQPLADAPSVLTATVVPTTVTEAMMPTPTNTPVPTATSVPTNIPTEVPHEHVWKVEEVLPACTTEGMSVEICECGAQQNLITIFATGHNVVKNVVKEATVEEEGAWEEVCTVCKEVITTGSIEKVLATATPVPTSTPIPTNTPTPTPKPTATPKPTPTPKPTATPTPAPVVVKSPPFVSCEGEVGANGLILTCRSDVLNAEEKLLSLDNATWNVLRISAGTYSEYSKLYPEENYSYTSYEELGTIVVVTAENPEIVDIMHEYTTEVWMMEDITSFSFGDTYEVLLKGKKPGTTTITITEYEINEFMLYTTGHYFEIVRETNSMKLNVTVKEADIHTQSEYDPVADGYPEFYREWQIGEKIYAQLWGGYIEKEANPWDGHFKGLAETGVLVIFGEGEMYDDCPLTRDDWRTYLVPSLSKIYVCEGVTKVNAIKQSAEHVRSIHLPSTLRTISERFVVRTTYSAYCNNRCMTELIIPEGVEYIGQCAFSGFHGLEKIVLPSTLKYIGGWAFSNSCPVGNCDHSQHPNKLKEVVIPDSVEVIDMWIFGTRDCIIKVPADADMSGWLYDKKEEYYWYADEQKIEYID